MSKPDTHSPARAQPRGFSRDLYREQAGVSGAQSLAAHKTDRNDARGLARLARTGFFMLVRVKLLLARSACRWTAVDGMTAGAAQRGLASSTCETR
jgi:hypothetical protein